ncbi:MerR family transcriptional regulator [Anaerococcus sp. AGMB00486]|uniref:MerR family transcriptional regulator n=2 Tax=Anaerococcus TaxID=165779 RepID=A0ABX2NA06_9FIRM|nr:MULTISPECIES: MerR family transcriptional regulator [Anaerococcus]MDY3006310.1 MerR family transcriptional regulator [Anaerococcus porci]MSS77671.1 MerR family transcriptional regulator [Anaerococcus porci]NVF11526.1 MerR family transcriptional regulator [Anaerococcus faecalis]
MKDKNELYSIGQASKLADVSTRTLRHYESIGIIKPDYVKENGYRYYNKDTIMMMSIIKYLQFMDFSLDEIKEFIFKANYHDIDESFSKLIKNTENEIKKLRERLVIIKDWHELINEAAAAFTLGNSNPSVKYFEEEEFIAYPFDFDYNYEKSILSLDYTNFVKEENNKITGAVMFYFSSFVDRIKHEDENRDIDAIYIQKTVKDIENRNHIFKREKGFYASVYHFGPYNNIKKSYKKLIEWSKSYRYKLKGSSIERFVVDTWTFRDKSQYLTEILIPIEMKVN